MLILISSLHIKIIMMFVYTRFTVVELKDKTSKITISTCTQILVKNSNDLIDA